METGQPFNPYRMFNGLIVPESLAAAKDLSHGAKLAYARLMRFAGKDGHCYPSVEKLAAEIGVGERQARTLLRELERWKLIRREPRFRNAGQTSNFYVFLWHPRLEASVKPTICTSKDGELVSRQDSSGYPRSDSSERGRKNPSGEESHSEESHSEETKSDLDYPPTNRKKRDSRLDVGTPAPEIRQYPRLREELCRYMMEHPNDERVYPTDRLVVDVMDSAGGATEREVIGCLRYLREERGLKPATRNGPRTFSWFRTAVADYFSRKRAREESANPCGFDQWAERNESREARLASGLSKTEFDAMTEVIETARAKVVSK